MTPRVPLLPKKGQDFINQGVNVDTLEDVLLYIYEKTAIPAQQSAEMETVLSSFYGKSLYRLEKAPHTAGPRPLLPLGDGASIAQMYICTACRG